MRRWCWCRLMDADDNIAVSVAFASLVNTYRSLESPHFRSHRPPWQHFSHVTSICERDLDNVKINQISKYPGKRLFSLTDISRTHRHVRREIGCFRRSAVKGGWNQTEIWSFCSETAMWPSCLSATHRHAGVDHILKPPEKEGWYDSGRRMRDDQF